MSDEPEIDVAVLDELDAYFEDRAETDRMLAELLESAERWTRLFVEDPESPEAHRAAHTLASSAAMVGAHALASAAREIEHALVRGRRPDPDVLARPAVLLARARAAWDERARRRGAG